MSDIGSGVRYHLRVPPNSSVSQNERPAPIRSSWITLRVGDSHTQSYMREEPVIKKARAALRRGFGWVSGIRTGAYRDHEGLADCFVRRGRSANRSR